MKLVQDKTFEIMPKAVAVRQKKDKKKHGKKLLTQVFARRCVPLRGASIRLVWKAIISHTELLF